MEYQDGENNGAVTKGGESEDTIDKDTGRSGYGDSMEFQDGENDCTVDEEIINDYLCKIDELISNDIKELYKEKPCKNPSKLLLFDINMWNEDRPEMLISMLKKICKLDGKVHDNYLLTKIIEQIYKCRNSKLVLPLSF